tara:strand:+ start:35 stop:481 length:447 start_codon:yes stop_codon:yes gene_type:complete
MTAANEQRRKHEELAAFHQSRAQATAPPAPSAGIPFGAKPAKKPVAKLAVPSFLQPKAVPVPASGPSAPDAAAKRPLEGPAVQPGFADAASACATSADSDSTAKRPKLADASASALSGLLAYGDSDEDEDDEDGDGGNDDAKEAASGS